MLLELLIMLELVAFAFLALGILPTTKSTDLEGNENKPPYMNKVLFVFVACIIFFSLGVISASYDYNYCYVNETSADYVLNRSISLATCASYNIESTELSMLNYGMGVLSIVLGIIIILFASTTRHIMGEQ